MYRFDVKGRNHRLPWLNNRSRGRARRVYTKDGGFKEIQNSFEPSDLKAESPDRPVIRANKNQNMRV